LAVKYFNSVGFKVVEINEKYSPENRSVFFDRLSSAGSGIVINCIGRIKQKSEFFDDLMLANSILPLDLYDNLAEDQFLIHPSTDCVFSENSDHLKTINSKPIPSDFTHIYVAFTKKRHIRPLTYCS
jgi:dTDP-4-dehydrorhamnose reductase